MLALPCRPPLLRLVLLDWRLRQLAGQPAELTTCTPTAAAGQMAGAQQQLLQQQQQQGQQAGGMQQGSMQQGGLQPQQLGTQQLAGYQGQLPAGYTFQPGTVLLQPTSTAYQQLPSGQASAA